MSQILFSVLSAVALFGGVLVCLRVGWICGRRRLRQLGEDGFAGLAAVEGIIFGLVGLLIAFTFTGAAGRFDARRQLITEQVNAIGTAWMRLDLVEPPARADLQNLFRAYVESQLSFWKSVEQNSAVVERHRQLVELEARIWKRAVEAVEADPKRPLAQTLLPPINEQFDLSNRRVWSTQQHPPLAIYLMLGLLILMAALLAGFAMSRAPRQSLLHLLGFSAIMALSVYLILDLEFPRLGLIQIGRFDQALMDLRDSMGPATANR